MRKLLTDGQRREIIRLRAEGFDFKTIARMERCTHSQARNVWYKLPEARRAALTQAPNEQQQRREEALLNAKRALAREITLARQERHTAPLFKVSPLLW